MFSIIDWMSYSSIGVVILLIILFVVAIIFLKYGFLWLQALLSGAAVSILDLVGMWFRKVDGTVIVINRINAVKAGLDISTDILEAHYLAGGNVTRVVRSVIAANKAGINLTVHRAMAIDLAGRDVLDAVHTSVLPKVIDCPDQRGGKTTIDAVAKDGIQVRAKARVTVRTNLDRLVGGATEETIIARVGEGIVTTIGSAENYKQVLESPDSISKKVLEKGLDAGSAFEILSIDIADVDVGENIGAKLQADQAAADLKVAQARAETRAAMARAQEQEMKAKTQEMKAKVVEAEAEIPKAISYAFREGKLGIMDYYSLRNIQADTDMRQSIAQPPTKPKG
ncbi:MAG: flotillin-like protein FloA [Planctomycetota bacterium]|nr:flotillin-like protein FloA [Planctomycetota bacterium]MDI6787252.1 flotillin-like protein FloA [Planctomycetota bacterium]